MKPWASIVLLYSGCSRRAEYCILPTQTVRPRRHTLVVQPCSGHPHLPLSRQACSATCTDQHADTQNGLRGEAASNDAIVHRQRFVQRLRRTEVTLTVTRALSWRHTALEAPRTMSFSRNSGGGSGGGLSVGGSAVRRSTGGTGARSSRGGRASGRGRSSAGAGAGAGAGSGARGSRATGARATPAGVYGRPAAGMPAWRGL